MMLHDARACCSLRSCLPRNMTASAIEVLGKRGKQDISVNTYVFICFDLKVGVKQKQTLPRVLLFRFANLAIHT